MKKYKKVAIGSFIRVMTFAFIVAYLGSKYGFTFTDRLLEGVLVIVWAVTASLEAESKQ